MLKDEAQAYALKIRQAGADVTVKRYAHEQHGFVGLAPRPGHKAAVADISSELAISPERVSDEKYKAIQKLRNYFQAHPEAA